MKKKLLYFYPFLVMIMAVQSLFVKISFSDHSRDPVMEYLSEKPEHPETGLYFSEGLIGRIFVMKKIQAAVAISADIPAEARLEETEEQLERIILFMQFSMYYTIFLVALALSSWFSLKNNLWFAVFLNRVFYVLSFFLVVQNISEKTMTIVNPALGIFFSVLFLLLFILIVYNFFVVKKSVKAEDFHLIKLKRKLQTDGEDESVGSSLPEKRFKSFFSILLHFAIIIVAGVVAGNILYIPVFTIQKHFSTEFGIILLLLVIWLSVFYVRKYHDSGYDPELGKNGNISASLVFLQFRFLKNTIGIVLAIAGVILFFTFLISLLALNSGILTDFGLIEKSTEL